MNLGTSNKNIEKAENDLNYIFPEDLRKFYLLSNGIECPPDWNIFSIYDSSNPRKTSGNNIVYENTKARWDYMSNDLISIGNNSNGNQFRLSGNPKIDLF